MAACRLSAALRLWAPVVLWAAVIFALSSVSDLGTGLGTWDLVPAEARARGRVRAARRAAAAGARRRATGARARDRLRGLRRAAPALRPRPRRLAARRPDRRGRGARRRRGCGAGTADEAGDRALRRPRRHAPALARLARRRRARRSPRRRAARRPRRGSGRARPRAAPATGGRCWSASPRTARRSTSGPAAEVSAALRAAPGRGRRTGGLHGRSGELARVALAQLGAARRVDVGRDGSGRAPAPGRRRHRRPSVARRADRAALDFSAWKRRRCPTASSRRS